MMSVNRVVLARRNLTHTFWVTIDLKSDGCAADLNVTYGHREL